MNKVVIKLGTSSLTNGTRTLSQAHMVEYARQIHHLQGLGFQVILVSSAAIAAGKELYPALASETSLSTKQMLASVGQVRLMHVWTSLFAIFGLKVGQILLTRNEMENGKQAANARATFEQLLSHNALPIVNENDTVATEEITLGDNDNLSAQVATLVKADLLILLTDQNGLYSADPRKEPGATPITRIEVIDDTHFSIAGDSSHPEKLGRGGMSTKLAAAKIAAENGIPTVIASAALPDVFLEIVAGKQIGTYVCAQQKH